MAATIGFRVWSSIKHPPDVPELAARQESVTGLRCAFAVHQSGPGGWLEMSAVPSASPTTACTLSRSTEPAVVARLMRDLRPTRTEFLHSLHLAKAVYFTATAARPNDLTRLIQYGLTWALAQMTRGLIAGDTPSGQMEYWWSDAFLARVEALRARVEQSG